MPRLFGTAPGQFLVLSVVLGLSYLVVNPPFAVNDEDVHLARIYELASGRLLTRSDAAGEYHYVPADYAALGAQYQAIKRRKGGRVHVRDVLALLRAGRPEGPLVYMRGRAGGYAPCAYHLQIPAVWIATRLDLGALWHLYLSRLVALAVYIGLAFRAVKLAGPLQWVFMAMALMPMALTQAAGVSSDGLVIGLAFLFFAWVARGGVCALPLTRFELAEAFACLVLLTLVKPVYVFLGVALLTLRGGPLHALWARWAFAGAATLAAALAYVAWASLRSDAPSAPDTIYSTSRQFDFLWSSPLGALELGARTLLRMVDDLLVESIFVRYGISSRMRFIGPLVSVVYAQLLIALAWGAARQRGLTAGRRKLDALILFMCWLAIVTAVPSALYLCCTKVGAPVVRGFHGRYLIPAYPALLLALALLGRPTVARWLRRRGGRVPLAAFVVSNLLCLFSLVGWHYY